MAQIYGAQATATSVYHCYRYGWRSVSAYGFGDQGYEGERAGQTYRFAQSVAGRT